MSDHKKALDKAKIQLMASPDSAFFTTLCFNMKHVWDGSIPTACTDGLTIRYSPAFFMGLSTAEQLFLLLHETLHVAFMHVQRRGDRDPRKWNIAADYVINDVLIQQGFQMPEGGLHDPQYAGMSSEEVYNLLPEDPQLPELPMEDAMGDSDGSEDGQGQAAQADLKEKIDDLLVRAALQSQMVGDKPGSIPGELEFYIKDLLAPKLPWHQILQKFMNKAIKQGYTWKRPNRRFFPKHYLPSRNSNALCDIVVAIDTSGSVTDDQFHQFTSEVYTILKRMKPSSLKLIQFDHDIKSIDDINDATDLMATSFHGRGGTCVEPVMEWAIKHKPTVLLVFTDGFFAQRYDNPGIPLVWLINDNTSFEPRHGKAIHFETR